ncbi:hypothetical protein U1Q18_023132 [Sarracenia purpurea var. burkii]
MYIGTACFDPNTMQEGFSEDGFSQTLPNSTTSFSMEDLSYHQNLPLEEAAIASSNGGAVTAAAIEIELHQQMGLDMEHCYNTTNTTTGNNLNIDNTHLMQEVVQDSNQLLPYDHSNWDPNLHHGMQEMGFIHNNNNHNEENLNLHHLEMQNGHHLLNLFHLPRCSPPPSLLPNSSLSNYMNPAQKYTNFPNSLGLLGDLPSSTGTALESNGVYESLFHLNNLPPQPPFFRELFQPLGHGYNNLPGSRSGSYFGGNNGMEEREVSEGLYQDGEGGGSFDNGVLEFGTKDWDMNCVAKKGKGGKGTTKHYTTEKERRENYGGKFEALKKLVPNYQSKPDRASVVADAIQYIQELRREVNELKILVEKKRCDRERRKRHKAEVGGATAAAAAGDLESWNNVKPEPDHHSYDGSSSLRSSWLQRKCKDAEVDVRIVDDEVTIKLAQRKKANCLLVMSRVLDDLQLDVQHVAGGLVGDNYSFLFNSKISEGSCVYASAIADKLIEVVNRQYAAIPPTSRY